jgi:beta-galactosidase
MNWPMNFNGDVQAVGTKGSATVRFDLKKAGPQVRIVLHPNVTSLRADGRDVSQIEVDVTDKDGIIVPDAADFITCSLTGPARIIGIENGDLDSTESYKALSHSVYQGRMLIYLQSQTAGGDCNLSVSSPNIQSASTEITIR